ncbi:methyl-accepting chemotaxis protein [Paenibacillus sp. CECT 9249]|uniref:methyl-accepting chemotaxis protein n=1 Tax=unclassified Paenibacillus TaxID=185978 RepID=UPI001E477561|nr:methyl-accepting chemotaxis protein [Paenibacillus sp. CECT 9249]CAH0119054.1 Methyl-accepting chemotaxis protein McpC [Paenibacillus sp. CECT 9249]
MGLQLKTLKELGGKIQINPFKSIGVKLFLIFFVSSLVFVLALGLYSYSQAKSIIKEQASEAHFQTIVQASEKIDFMLQNYVDITLSILMNNDLQKAITESSSQHISDYEKLINSQKIEEILQRTTLGNNTLLGATLIPVEEKGKFYSSNGSSTEIEQLKKEPWFQQTIDSEGRPVFIPSQSNGIATHQGQASFGLARLVKNTGSGKATHVLMLEMKTAAFDGQVGSLNLGDGSSLQVVTADNQVVYSNIPENIGQAAEVELKKDESGAIVNGGENMKDAAGKEVLAIFNGLKAANWSLVGMIPVEKLVEKTQQIRILTIVAALIVTLVAALIGAWMIRMIARPLVQLRNLMNEGARGNLAVRTKSKSQDEIGQLSAGFNEMMDQITNLVQHTNESARSVLDTASELSEASKKTAISAKEIAVATEEIANGATNLAVEAEKGNDLTMNMAKQMKMVIEANGEMGSSAAKVEQSSEHGIRYMEELTEKTSLTEEMVRSMVEKVDSLQESTQSIRKILDMMNNISKQTNILSLNATIEASRAGAAGKGFMVVADEIRNLAEQSRQSIGVVGEMIETIQREIGDTVNVLSNAYPIFNQQIQSVKEANEIFSMVRTQMGGFIQQLDSATDSIQQLDQAQVVLAEAMSNVSAVAEESSATSEEVASLSNEQLGVSGNLVDLSNKLEDVSAKLKETLARFTL